MAENEKLVLKAKGEEYFPMTANTVMESLRKHHSRDVFVEECKNGQSWGNNLLRLDAWAMPRSYSPFRTIGYEVKVSRADFEQDQKWIEYVDYCHLFFFVCPAGLIRSTDLPKGIGLKWVSKSGTLHTKTHATKHEPDIAKLNNMLTYIVMARSVIADNMYERGNAIPKDRLTLIREEVERAQKNKDLAYVVKGHVKEVHTKIVQLESDLLRREQNMKEFADKLQRLGIKWDYTKQDWTNVYEVNAKIAHLKKDVDWQTLQEIDSIGSRLTELAKRLRELEKDGSPNGING
jgi:hypothetical protein